MTEYRPRIRPRFQCDVVKGFGIVLATEADLFLGQGGIYERLAPLLDGRRTVQQVLEAVETTDNPLDVFEALDRLKGQDILMDGKSTGLLPEQEVFWDQLGFDPACVSDTLSRVAVSVATFGDLPPGFKDGFVDLLAQSGVRIAAHGPVSIVLTDSYRAPGLDQFQRESRAQGRRVLTMRTVGDALWIGPEFDAEQPGCWDCLVHRIDAHQKMDRFLTLHAAQRHTLQNGRAGLPSVQCAVLGLAATEATKWIAGDPATGFVRRICRIDTARYDKSEHVLVAHPQCNSCKPTAPLASSETVDGLTLSRQPGTLAADGGYRTAPAEQTVANLLHHVSPVTGIITSFKKVRQQGRMAPLIHCYVADHVFTPMNGNLDRLREGREGRASGKGRTDIQAQASALGEAIERYSGVFQGAEQHIVASLSDLQDLAIHPNECMLFSPDQLAQRGAAHVTAGGPAWLPDRFDPDAEMDWTPVWSLTGKTTKYLPTSLCYYGYGQQFDDHTARADSNGCAAGNSIEEAILQGFLELVERDGVALWWYNRVQRPAVDLASFGDPYFDEIVEIYRQMGREIWVIDITTDLEIPTFAAISRRTDHPFEQLLFGFGAHFDAGLAISRALTEVNQGLTLTGENKNSGDAPTSILQNPSFRWWNNAALANHPYMAPSAQGSVRVAADFPTNQTKDVYDAVQTCVTRATANNLELLVLDQSRPETGLKVVRVFAPGLRHFWPRFAPGRLFETPVQLGWVDQPRKEQDLNPAHFFL